MGQSHLLSIPNIHTNCIDKRSGVPCVKMLILLPMLLLTNLVYSLPEGCRDYTVGECSPEKDELIDTYEMIPEAPICQHLCTIQGGCNYFRHSKSSTNCTLYHYRFLSSCNLIAGPKEPGIDACSDELAPSCNSFIRENCEYQGERVLEKDSITDAHACQELLLTVADIYGAAYFMFNSTAQNCVLFSTKDMDCDAISGPKSPAMDTCDNPTTAAPTTVKPSPAPSTTAKAVPKATAAKFKKY